MIRMVLRDLKRENIAEETKDEGAVLLQDPSQISLFKVLDRKRNADADRRNILFGRIARCQKGNPEACTRTVDLIARMKKIFGLIQQALHLQEKGLIERSGEHNLQATRRLQIYDQLRSIEQKIEDACGAFFSFVFV